MSDGAGKLVTRSNRFLLQEIDDSAIGGMALSHPAAYRNSGRVWACAYCGGCEPEMIDDRPVTRCTRCGGPRKEMT